MSALETNHAVYPHFFSRLGRVEADAALKDHPVGTFLVRDSSRSDCLVISLRQSAKTLHLLVVRRGQGFGLDPSAWKDHDIGKVWYATLPLLIARLKQERMLKKGLSPSDVAANEKKAGAVAAAGAPAAGAGKISEAKRAADDQERAKTAHKLRLEGEYKGMVTVMLRNNKLDGDELAQLAQWRQAHAFSDAQHDAVLAALDITPEKWEKLKDFTEDVDESSKCSICLEEVKSAVFVDCGHMATCIACAARVDVCPICRKPKTKVIRVFS